MRAVESPEPDASCRDVGLHAQMKTSEVCPASVVTCSSGVGSIDSSLAALGAPEAPEDDAAHAEEDATLAAAAGVGSASSGADATGASSLARLSCLPSEEVRNSMKFSASTTEPSSATLRSSSEYMMPFCTRLTSSPGAIFEPFMFDLATRLSQPKVYAACLKPDSCRYRYTRKLSSSEVRLMSLAPLSLAPRTVGCFSCTC
mmetsp:Transcript_53287/g.122462  ORF Transcript_53287/g.122462 Transcript_53287/m.122462 type:complete len:202 (+) Transcript_53287:1125-1730(+)